MARWESVDQWDFWGPRPRSIPYWARVIFMVAVAGAIGFFFGRDVGILKSADVCVQLVQFGT